MKSKSIVKLGILSIILIFFASCNLRRRSAKRHAPPVHPSQFQESDMQMPGNTQDTSQMSMLEINQQALSVKTPSSKAIIVLLDSNKDGKLAPNETKGPLKRNFTSIDANHDGYLSESELSNANQQQRNTPTVGQIHTQNTSRQVSARQAPSFKEIITQMDTNKDGKLEKSETKGPLKNDFTTLDANKDGFLSESELTAKQPQRNAQSRGQMQVQQSSHQIPKEQATSYKEIIATMDSNKDGKLEESEVKGSFKSNFATIDTDNNGFLSEKELSNTDKIQRNASQPRDQKQQSNRSNQKPGGQMLSSKDLIGQMDSNKDGKLEESEVKGSLKNDFATLDANNDGFISEDELNAKQPQLNNQSRNQMPARRGRQKPSAKDLIAQMDSNKDGKLEESEIKGPLKNDFVTRDTNKDGYLTETEINNEQSENTPNK